MRRTLRYSGPPTFFFSFLLAALARGRPERRNQVGDDHEQDASGEQKDRLAKVRDGVVGQAPAADRKSQHGQSQQQQRAERPDYEAQFRGANAA